MSKIIYNHLCVGIELPKIDLTAKGQTNEEIDAEVEAAALKYFPEFAARICR